MIPGLKQLQEEAAEPKPRTITTGDLFLAHDFDIQLELDAKLPRKCIFTEFSNLKNLWLGQRSAYLWYFLLANLPIVARPSAPHIREPVPRRSLNLEDYKRKRGLI